MKIFNWFIILVIEITGVIKTIFNLIGWLFTGTLQNNSFSYNVGEMQLNTFSNKKSKIKLINNSKAFIKIYKLNIEDSELNLNVSPCINPTNQSLSITHPVNNNFNLSITMTDKLIYSGKKQKKQKFNLKRYPKGIYRVSVSAENCKKNTYRIIKTI